MDTQNSKPWPSWYPHRWKTVPALRVAHGSWRAVGTDPGMLRYVWSFWRKEQKPPKRSGRPGCRNLFCSRILENNQKHLNLQTPDHENKLPDLRVFGGLVKTRFHRMSYPSKFKFSGKKSVYTDDTKSASSQSTSPAPNRIDASRHAWQLTQLTWLNFAFCVYFWVSVSGQPVNELTTCCWQSCGWPPSFPRKRWCQKSMCRRTSLCGTFSTDMAACRNTGGKDPPR